MEQSYNIELSEVINEKTLEDCTLSYLLEDKGVLISLHGAQDRTWEICLMDRKYKEAFQWMLNMSVWFDNIRRIIGVTIFIHQINSTSG